MPHSLILGTTGSGKSTLAKKLCAKLKEKGVGTIVLDPMSDPEWHCDFRTKNEKEFLQVVKNSQQCCLFIDESGQTIGRYNEQMIWLATQARHWGHQSFFITQRGQQLNKTVRDQCDRLYIFRVSKNDAVILAEEFCQDELLEASKLDRFVFIKTGRFATPEKIDLKNF